MKRIQGFVLGVLATVLVVSLTTTALAAGGYISFNRVNIRHNGTQIGAAGEDYVLDNGCVAPYSLSYTDEKGGNTTYLPVRKVSELLGVDIGWDGATKTVTIGEEPANTGDVSDYSDWTEEDETAYQEFKALWQVRDSDYVYFIAFSDEEIKKLCEEVDPEIIKKFSVRLAKENFTGKSTFPFSTSNREDLWYVLYTGAEQILNGVRMEGSCDYSRSYVLKALSNE